MPRAFECPSSMLPAAAPVNAPNDQSDLGTAAHFALARHVQGDDADLAEIARVHGVDADDLAPLVTYGRKAWAELRRLFPSVLVEAPLESDITSGTADLLRADAEAVVVADWKSGRNRRAYRRQVEAYAYAARAKHGMPASGVVTAIIVWLRFAEFEVMHFTSEQLDAFRAGYLALERSVGKQFAPGEHCTGCPRALECEARSAYLRSAGSALVAAKDDALTPAKLAELYPQAQLLEKAIEAYRVALRLALADGPIPIGDGKQLELVEARRAVIDARLAWPVLEGAGFSEEDIARTISMSKGEVEAVAGEKAPPREKGKRKASIVRALEDAGALTHATFTKLQQTKRATNGAEEE